MIENYRKYTILTEEIDNKFIVYFVDRKSYKEFFKTEFFVYRNFDSKGLVDDAIDIYERKLKLNV